MIKSVHVIVPPRCEMCRSPAVFEVEFDVLDSRVADNVEPIERYCKRCLPADAKQHYDNEVL